MNSSARPERKGAVDTRINVEQARKQAKDLVKAFKAWDSRALDRVRWNHPQFRRLSESEMKAREFSLADAQLVIARTHHIESWPKLLEHVHALETADPAVTLFENAADAIISGNLEALQRMLREHPQLIHQRSTRAHQSTLLHYVSANGVEDYRQVTPTNIVEITQCLLDAGAEVDAPSNAYGGGSTTLGLVSTSAHPRAMRVQIALIDLLLSRGAKIDGKNDLQNLVYNALGNGCPEAAYMLAGRGAGVNTLFAMAGAGNLEGVRSLFPIADKAGREAALFAAALRGHAEIVVFLLDNGVDVAAPDEMSALHIASGEGHIQLMDLLIKRGAPLEKLNMYEGSVLSSTLWFAYNFLPEESQKRDFPGVIRFLIAAGARTDFYPDMLSDIEGVYQRAKR